MDLAVLSDLHIGRGDKSDRFMHDDAEFIRFLSFLNKNFKKTILLGDIFETLHGTLPMPHIELDKCIAAHPELSHKLIHNKKNIYLHGNHDMVTEKILGNKDILIVEKKIKIMFLHGHQFGWLTSAGNSLTSISAWIAGWGRRTGHGRFTSMMEKKYTNHST